jgi:hypothetical protein
MILRSEYSICFEMTMIKKRNELGSPASIGEEENQYKRKRYCDSGLFLFLPSVLKKEFD